MILASEEDTHRLGARIAAGLRPGDVITLSGPLGVGKTALARGILRALGHEGDVPSPSFAIVQPYETLVPPVWHVDLYRVEDSSELDELGLDSTGNGALIVEWPDRAGEAAFSQALQLTMNFAPDGARSLTAQVPPSWERRWPPR